MSIRTPGLAGFYIEAQIRSTTRWISENTDMLMPAKVMSRIHADLVGIEVSLILLYSQRVSSNISRLEPTGARSADICSTGITMSRSLMRGRTYWRAIRHLGSIQPTFTASSNCNTEYVVRLTAKKSYYISQINYSSPTAHSMSIFAP